LQKTKQHFFKDRALFYTSFSVQDQAIRGKDWNFQLNGIFTIAILDFVFDEDVQIKHKKKKNPYRIP